MCVTWSQAEWLTETSKPGSEYNLVAEYANAEGAKAITIGTKSNGNLMNVYNAGGTEAETFWYDFTTERFLETYHEQLEASQRQMVAHGFTKPAVQTPGIAQLATESKRTVRKTVGLRHGHAPITYDQQPVDVTMSDLDVTEADEDETLASIR